MKRIALLVLAIAAVTLNVHAQVYKWVDKDGKVQYSDMPPPAGATTMSSQRVTSTAPSAPSAPVATDDKAAQKKPPDPVKDYDKRRTDAAEKQKKDDAADKLAAQKKEACENARGYYKTLEAGGKISKTDANGERYFLEDDQIKQELANAQKTVTENCK